MAETNKGIGQYRRALGEWRKRLLSDAPLTDEDRRGLVRVLDKYEDLLMQIQPFEVDGVFSFLPYTHAR